MKLKFSVFPGNHSPGFMIYLAASQVKLGLQRTFIANRFHIAPEQCGLFSALFNNEG